MNTKSTASPWSRLDSLRMLGVGAEKRGPISESQCKSRVNGRARLAPVGEFAEGLQGGVYLFAGEIEVGDQAGVGSDGREDAALF